MARLPAALAPRRLALPIGFGALFLSVSGGRAGAAERPAFDVAVGAGLSVDPQARNVDAADKPPVPAYLVSLGLGSGGLGVALRLIANAPGGNPATPEVQRVGVDGVVLVRPFALAGTGPDHLGGVILRSVSLGVGPVVEQIILSTLVLRHRVGVVVGAHFDVPVAGDAASGELRVRVGARRVFAKASQLQTRSVADAQLDVYAALALVF